MPKAILTTYHGEQLSFTKLRRRVRLGDRMLLRWRREGRLTEQKIDAYLEARKQRREAREKRGYPVERLDEPTMSRAEAQKLSAAVQRMKLAAARMAAETEKAVA